MALISLDLAGQWQFKEYPLSARRMRDLDSADWMPATVPSSIFSSLISAGKIDQTEINTHPENFSWVSDKPWIYRKVFDASTDLLSCDRIDLVFDGLDTIASIWLNNRLIGRASNMFIPFRFDVSGKLQPKNNSLLVKFDPAVRHAKKLMQRYTTFDESAFTNPHRVYIRKAQYQFGWDFCPSLPGCGIWRPVRLEGIRKARLADLHVRTIDCNHHHADIRIAAKLDTVISQQFHCRLALSDGGRTIEQNLTFDAGEDSQSTVVRIENPSLWWPAGYGRQNLYTIDAKLLSSNETIDRKQKSFGIRTVKLNRSPDEHGEKFRFEINGQPIFAKGANWVPASVFAGSVTSADYEKLLHLAKGAAVNMLRVWGGGYYEADEFYSLCDRLGIMVWQDFMFACAYYPDRKWFLEEVETEATAIMKQLRNHPCIVLWCGNNENDWLHVIGRFGSGRKFYGKVIYHKLLPRIVAELDPDANYTPTTPTGNRQNPNSPNSGSYHEWSVWAFHQPIRRYICPPEEIPRFVTEFGLQSVPCLGTLKTFCPPESLRPGSRIVEKHNYQLDGNSRLYRYMADYFTVPTDPESFIYLSQLAQARAVKTYVEYLRLHNIRNSGVLFWQFDDCCPAISWSAVDYRKGPKALYYYAGRFFAELLVAVLPQFKESRAGLYPELKSLSIVVVNERPMPLTATLQCSLIDLFGHELDRLALPVAVAPFRTSTPMKIPKAFAFPEKPEKTALHLKIQKDGRKIAENLFLYLPDKYIDWPEVKIDKDFSQVTDKRWKLKLKSNAIAKDVKITPSINAVLSDNFVDLIPPYGVEVNIACRQKIGSLDKLVRLNCLKEALWCHETG